MSASALSCPTAYGAPPYSLRGSVDLCRTDFAWSLRQAKRLAALPAFVHVSAQKSLSRRGRCVDSTLRKGHRKGEVGLSTERKPSGSTTALDEREAAEAALQRGAPYRPGRGILRGVPAS
jgi:hypothetical protein